MDKRNRWFPSLRKHKLACHHISTGYNIRVYYIPSDIIKPNLNGIEELHVYWIKLIKLLLKKWNSAMYVNTSIQKETYIIINRVLLHSDSIHYQPSIWNK